MSLVFLSGVGCAPVAYAVFGLIASFTSPAFAWTVSALLAFGGPVAAARALSVPPARH
jgi:MFS transporter, DHA3 family, macrolide efflux protein